MKNYLKLFELPLTDLMARANTARRHGVGNEIDLCTICNARSGRCTEDCKYCAQSAHYNTEVCEYPLLPDEELLSAARRAKEIGSPHFSIVTSGHALTGEELERIIAIIPRIRNEVGIGVCTSLGCLDYDSLCRLRDAGMKRYHHNLETSRSFYPSIVTTHSYDDRVKTVLAAKKAGLSVCCGGIFGVGESRLDRVEMALELKEISPDIVPLNFLIPIPGTPLGDQPLISPMEALKTISVFRIILRNKTIKIAGGRELIFGDFQATAFLAGANGMIIGGYLTRGGRDWQVDKKLAEEVMKTW
jgi:biotin synthase